MRSSELKVGTSYYANRSNNWKTQGYGGYKVTLLDLGPWHEYTGWSAPAKHDITLADGTTLSVAGISHGQGGVLVRGEKYGRESVFVVRAQAIRGEYDECMAKIQTARDAATAQRVRAAQRAADEKTRDEAAIAALAAVGIQATREYVRGWSINQGWYHIVIKVATAEEIAARLS